MPQRAKQNKQCCCCRESDWWHAPAPANGLPLVLLIAAAAPALTPPPSVLPDRLERLAVLLSRRSGDVSLCIIDELLLLLRVTW